MNGQTNGRTEGYKDYQALVEKREAIEKKKSNIGVDTNFRLTDISAFRVAFFVLPTWINQLETKSLFTRIPVFPIRLRHIRHLRIDTIVTFH